MWFIVDDERLCEATAVMLFSHIYAFFYVLFFFGLLVAQVMFIVVAMANLQSVSIDVLRRAKSFDDNYCPQGVPVASLLVRAFLLRDVEDTESVEILAVQGDIHALQAKKASLDAEQAQLDKALAESEARQETLKAHQEARQADNVDEAKFVEEHARKLEEALDKAAPVMEFAAVLSSADFAEQAKQAVSDAAASMPDQASLSEAQEMFLKRGTEAAASAHGAASAAADAAMQSETFRQGMDSARSAGTAAHGAASAAADSARQQAAQFREDKP
jgi:hypothetical protein